MNNYSIVFGGTVLCIGNINKQLQFKSFSFNKCEWEHTTSDLGVEAILAMKRTVRFMPGISIR